VPSQTTLGEQAGLLDRGPGEAAAAAAAVEVASYRIAQEAITNVARHARARTCSVYLSIDQGVGALVLEVIDDGVGMPKGRRAGVGLSSMRERAEELGGTLAIEPVPEGGTRVLALLPLPTSEERLKERGRRGPHHPRPHNRRPCRRTEGLRAVLGSEPDMEVVGEAATGKEVVERSADLQPDVILMDIQMPGINGIEATRRILDANPVVGVVVLTMFEDDDSVFSAMRAGARGYVLKGAHPTEILKVLRAVAGGEAHFGPEIARRLVDFFSTPKPASPEQAFPELTSREREILTS
jgi:DNA-binding NarL/FixJ family response regulator